ncbi:hypothetical protein CYCD_26330 [Tenuifilaceae bacterium CYCD]|nr:hypothetical protein CYCD_26330 [Tenuifilaceae bacterium CYCD]
MKNTFLIKLIGILAIVATVFVACTEDVSDKRLDPKLSTSLVQNLTSDSVIVEGFVVAAGDGFIERGICYSNTESPTTADNKVVYEGDSKSATFAVMLRGLTRLTTYHVRAYAINESNTIYGEDITINTPAALPTLADIVVPTIAYTANNGVTATTAIDITDDGGDGSGPDETANITSRGVVYGYYQNPTIDSSKTQEGTGAGAFNSLLTGLKGVKTYYLRAYAQNKIGVVYSNQVSFTTEIAYPIVITSDANVISGSEVAFGGIVEDNGGAEITSRGICWSLNANPTLADNVVAGTAIDTFKTDTIAGFTASTTYHVRAFATNSRGTSYGEDKTFTPFPPELYMTGSGVGLDAESWNWYEPLKLIPVHSHPELFWKIVWMKGSGEFKFAPQPAWSGDFGKTGDATNGVYSIGGSNIPVPTTAGYYMVVVDLKNKTIEIAEPKVYGMGVVFGGWTTGVAANLFTVDNTNQVIKYTGVPNSGELRMYVSASTLVCDWWQAEFIILNDKIEFRGKGNDQTSVNVTAGQNISLNFKLGTGTISSK